MGSLVFFKEQMRFTKPVILPLKSVAERSRSHRWFYFVLLLRISFRLRYHRWFRFVLLLRISSRTVRAVLVSAYCPIFPKALKTFSGVIGQERIHTPTASCTALAITGAAPFTLISEIDFPPKGPKGSSV